MATDERHERRHTLDRMLDAVGGWISDLDACDGYLVLLGDPADGVPPDAVGPYTGAAALYAADQHARCGARPVRVVRLHHSPSAGA